MSKAGRYIIIITLLLTALSLSAELPADSVKDQITASLRPTPFTWYERGIRKQAWIALDEAHVYPQRVAGARQNARTSIKNLYPSASIIAEHEELLDMKLPASYSPEELSNKLRALKASPGIRAAHPVFYTSPTARRESRMVLTDQVIVQFPLTTSQKTIKALESRYGFKRIKTFPCAQNTYLYDAGDPLRGLALASELAQSGQVNYAYPNWIRVRSKRTIPNDSLFPNQWHLLNSGQGGGIPGEDVNITTVWDTYRGTNKVIALVDDGLEINHADLTDNVLASLCWDYIAGNSNTTDGEHGTSCAGVAAGRGFNGMGITGAAPWASLVGHRILSDSGVVYDSDVADALTRDNGTIDIYSNSWGPPDSGSLLDGPSPVIRDALASGATSGRGGRGNIYLWAGGNGGDVDNSNYDGFANSRYVIAVSASTNYGSRSSYSEGGANILVNAPSNGGSYGITTTDRSGSLGYSSSDYTDSFGGTSSATPLVAGIIALMLEANPNLTWRDVRKILAQTANQNDPGDPEWTSNGAGYPINPQYGFGRVDALAAVNAALTWTPLGQEVQVEGSSSPNKNIPDNNFTGVTDSISIDTDILVEFVEVTFSAADHPYWPDLEIVLISPEGTESVLAQTHPVTGTPSGSFDNWIFGSVRHLGENARGTWTLRVRDLAGTHTGTFQSWTLKIHGTALAPDTQAPAISGLTISSFTDTSATITWTTDEPSGSTIRFGIASSSWQNYPSEAHDATLTTTHSITINGLSDGTTYFFRVGSTDKWGNGTDLNSNGTNPSEELSFITYNYAPAISNIIMNSVSPSSATIFWTTNEPSDSFIQYGTESSTWDAYPSSEYVAQPTTSHSLTISGLAEKTTYYFRVGSTDIKGNGPSQNANSSNPSPEYLFTTTVTLPYVVGTSRIDFANKTIDITFSKTGMQGASSETNYRFSPSLAFRTPGGTDDIVKIGPSSYRLYLASISRYTIFQMMFLNITDSAGNALSRNTITLNDNNTNGMADDWETSYGVSSPNSDTDGDGLTNIEEYRNGTSPTQSDTDGDGLPDGWEVRYGLDPLDPTGQNGASGDPDGDSWTNTEEFRNGTDPSSISSPLPTPPEVVDIHPYDTAGISDTTRIPMNVSFAVKLSDAAGINLTDPGSITFTIDDGTNPAYTVSLADTDVVRVVKLSTDQDTSVSRLWAVYDRSREASIGDFPFGATITITVQAMNRRGDWMEGRSYSFGVETEAEYKDANLASPTIDPVKPGDSVLKDIYDTGIRVVKGELAGAAIVFSSTEPVRPEFGPPDEIPLLDMEGISAVGEVLNLQPPTIFDTPVRVFIPCLGFTDLSKVSVYFYDGTMWILACNGQGNVQEAALGWMVEGSRVDHPDFSPPSIEIKLYHFSALQAGSSTADVPVKSSGGGGGSGCFIETADPKASW